MALAGSRADLRSWFFIDAPSSFPVELVDLFTAAAQAAAAAAGEDTDNTAMKALRALRMVRKRACAVARGVGVR